VHEGNGFSQYVYFNTPKDDGYFISSDGWIPPDDYSWENRSWLLEVEKLEGIYIDFPSIDSVTNKIVTVLRKRVIDGEFRGALNIAIDLTELSQKINSFPLEEDVKAFLLFGDGKLISYSDTLKLIPVDGEVPTIESIIPGFDVTKNSFSLDDKIYYKTSLREAEWSMWLEVPTSHLKVGLSDAIASSAIIFIISVLMSFILSYWIGNRTTKPLRRLKESARSMSDGQYAITISPELLLEKDEIGQFANAFNEMRQKIFDRESELIKTLAKLKTTIHELEQKNMEVQALYEEMAATEEVLRENYDSLEDYKNQIEYTTTHNVKTGHYNQEYFYDYIKRLNNAESLEGQTLLYVTFLEKEHYIQSLNASLADKLHQQIIMTIQNVLEDEDKGQLFDLGHGTFAVLFERFILGIHIQRIFNTLFQNIKNIHVSETLMLRVTLVAGGYSIKERVNHASFSPEEVLELAKSAFFMGSYKLDKSIFKDTGTIFWYNDSMYNEHKIKLMIERDLFKAIENKEFYMVYQPQYDIERKIIGAEALIRWEHPTIGMVSPDLFISIAEKLGVVDGIDLFVLDQVTSDIMGMKSESKHIPIAINTSLLEWLNPNYINILNKTIRSKKLTKDSLIIEITETAFSENIELVREKLTNMVNENYHVHLDDFGSGYSSFMYLSNFPVDVLKIDRKFVLTKSKVMQRAMA
jgi:EAL domain-containing protein (putative c-di-GMP-specific phosphodiesterase class I)/HAMP domain-containing protein/GGDEF domain-containing protein